MRQIFKSEMQDFIVGRIWNSIFSVRYTYKFLESALSFKLSLNSLNITLCLFVFFSTRLNPFYFTFGKMNPIIDPRDISKKLFALIALFTFFFRLISDRSKFEYDRLKNPRWSNSPWVFRSYIDRFKYSFVANCSRSASDRASRSWKSFPAILSAIGHILRVAFSVEILARWRSKMIATSPCFRSRPPRIREPDRRLAATSAV